MTDPAPLTDADKARFVLDVIWSNEPDDDDAAKAERSLKEIMGSLRAARAEVERLRACLDDIYPTIASRAIQLTQAGEEKAAARWDEVCRRVAATWSSRTA